MAFVHHVVENFQCFFDILTVIDESCSDEVHALNVSYFIIEVSILREKIFEHSYVFLGFESWVIWLCSMEISFDLLYVRIDVFRILQSRR